MRKSVLGNVIVTFTLLFVAVGFANPALAGEPRKLINSGDDNVAIRGFDSVAYFTIGRPTQGVREFTFHWRDANWQFANSKHLNMFADNPERYAPKFGGFCAMAMTQGVLKVIDPQAWTVVDGKLYLNFSVSGRDKFREDLGENIAKSEAHWVELLKN